jgi:hypothetical protein
MESLPVPMHQSSCSVLVYVFDDSFCTAVASSQPGIVNVSNRCRTQSSQKHVSALLLGYMAHNIRIQP